MKKISRPESIGLAIWNDLMAQYNGQLPRHIQAKLKREYPIQYLIGEVEFFNARIKVNRHVLIPRMETELLVQKTIALLKPMSSSELTIIDLGTGSGAIAIALALAFDCQVDAIDVSRRALKIAQQNAVLNQAKVNFKRQNLLKTNLILNHKVIISNPPYLAKNEPIARGVKKEPQIAIYAPHDGLLFYEKIIDLAVHNLEKEFWLIFEIGCYQKTAVSKMIQAKFPTAQIKCYCDYNHCNRFIFARIKK